MTGNATACARAIIEELIGRGVRDVVLAPGARNAPLSYECFEADRIGLLRLHVRVDERTAGFLGLGLAKGAGAPVAVVTTSGTATSNLHPAVLEAWHAHVPLIAITASRPRSVINTGANQSTDQDQLFGRHVRGYAGLSDQCYDSSYRVPNADARPGAAQYRVQRAVDSRRGRLAAASTGAGDFRVERSGRTDDTPRRSPDGDHRR